MALTYSAAQTLTISPASLASSATFVAGQESNQVDNTTDLYLDALVTMLITVGTTPTANTVIQPYVWGNHVSLATTALDVLDGTDSAETITNAGVLQSFLRPAPPAIITATTSNVGHNMYFSVCEVLGVPVLPPFWGIYLSHNTGVALNSTAGNHVVKWIGVKY
jgi:hypothetical protein